MKKVIILSLLIACACTACRHNNYLNLAENDWKKDELKGRVKKIVRASYDHDALDALRVVEYNDKGFLVRKKDSTVTRKWVDITTYLYDTVGNTMTATRIVNDSIKKVEYYEYDQNGNLLEVKRSTSKATYSYDDRNRMVKEENYAAGSLYSRITWEYKPDGSIFSERFDGATGRKESETFKNDSLEIYKSFDDAGKVKETRLSRMDKAGNRVYGEARDKQGKLDQYSNIYYDQFNNRIKSISFNAEKNAFDTLTTDYTYDKMGNWTTIKGLWSREITYW